MPMGIIKGAPEVEQSRKWWTSCCPGQNFMTPLCSQFKFCRYAKRYHQGGTRSRAAQEVVDLMLSWSEFHDPTLLAVKILEVEMFLFLEYSFMRINEYIRTHSHLYGQL